MAEWIEILDDIGSGRRFFTSPLAMAEWIEIISWLISFPPVSVSASDGGVD